jgi:Holliday junction resolvase RusA-like endonuclease
VTFTFRVEGVPGPQGSKMGFVNPRTGRVTLVESSLKVKPWRAAVVAAYKAATRNAPQEPLLGPVQVDVHFYLPRPKHHYGTGRNAGRVKPTAPTWVAVKPDVDKTLRSTLDALTSAGAYRDDAQVVAITCTKTYADTPGALITITPLE